MGKRGKKHVSFGFTASPLASDIVREEVGEDSEQNQPGNAVSG
jgi:hypothetical protein